MIKSKVRQWIYLCMFFSGFCQAELNIEITQGMAAAVPIAVFSFEPLSYAYGGASNFPVNVSEVIGNDLRISGRFRPVDSKAARSSNRPEDVDLPHWQNMGVENIVIGKIEPVANNRYNVSFELWDVYKVSGAKGQATRVDGGELVIPTGGNTNYILASKKYTNVSGEQLRALAHHISDVIYEKLTGVRGAFSTRIAYVSVHPLARGNEYTLEVADMDGYNPKPLVRSREPMMSPAWSPNGKKLAYVSFEKKASEIAIIDVSSGKKETITKFPGINGAPAWSPDGMKLALVLSKSGSPKVYILDLITKNLSAITDGTSIDTEPAWSPDGESIYFTSGRGGKPQIYKVALRTGRTERITFQGNYSARPRITDDGRKLVMIYRESGGTFCIASQDLRSGSVTQLTNSDYDDSPSLAPNNAMVIYGTKAQGKRVLGIVTIDGRAQLRLPEREGSVQEPAWSPFLS